MPFPNSPVSLPKFSASAFYSDKKQQRGLFNVWWMSIVVIGYAILLGVNPVTSPGVAYCEQFLSMVSPGSAADIRLFRAVALFLCVGGVAPSIACTISWLGANVYVLFLRRFELKTELLRFVVVDLHTNELSHQA